MKLRWRHREATKQCRTIYLFKNKYEFKVLFEGVVTGHGRAYEHGHTSMWQVRTIMAYCCMGVCS